MIKGIVIEKPKKKFKRKFKYFFKRKEAEEKTKILQKGMYLSIFVLFGVVAFNLKPHSNETYQPAHENEIRPMQYVFVDENGKEYNVFNNTDKVHGTSKDRSYLFEEEKLVPDPDFSNPDKTNYDNENDQQTTYTGENTTGKNATGTINQIPNQEEDNHPQNSEHTGKQNEQEENTTNKRKGKVFIFKLDTNILVFPEREIVPSSETAKSEGPLGINIIPSKQKCMTPRGYEIDNGESILAYQQVEDALDVCNIQRRICNDGKLSGTFRQQSCALNPEYTYQEEVVVSYNNQKSDPFVQPTPNPGNTADNITKNTIEEYLDKPSQKSTDIGPDLNPLKQDPQEVDQTKRVYHDCKSPRGETVKHAQFVIAYKYENGFTDAPCEVQLRTCYNGTLEGTYQKIACKTREVSYEDYVYGSLDPTKPAPQKVIKTLKKDDYPEIEDGNGTNSSSLDKVIDILNKNK